mgnify:CR=1 FL=1|jgi:hypothetical protein
MRNLLFPLAILGLFWFWRWRTRWRYEHAAAQRSAPPVARGTRVLVDDAGVAIDADGPPRRVAWDDIGRVHIESVEGGLDTDAVTWVLTPASGGAPLRVAQTAAGADAMIARLQQLPGFRYEPMIQSMITTDATHFLVWER